MGARMSDSLDCLPNALSMDSISKQSLGFLENLTVPEVQVVVMKANVGCNHCRQRIKKVISKMNGGFLDMVVDVSKKEVTIRAVVDTKKRRESTKAGFSGIVARFRHRT